MMKLNLSRMNCTLYVEKVIGRISVIIPDLSLL
jgi:hypothetical protein